MNKVEIIGAKIGGLCIIIDGEHINHVEKHSPDGMQVGYGGSGPADCARSILIHKIGDEKADKLYHQFKWDIVAKWKHLGGKTVIEEDIDGWIADALKTIDK